MFERPDVNRTAVTLIEVLIVIAIIGLLLQLALPAIEMSRETARQAECQNNLRQLAMAAQLHLGTHERFPTGGWTSVWVGDPNRGYGEEQPGGWCFNLLPYLEYQDLHDMGKGDSLSARRLAGRQMFATPVPVYVCPSRRLARPWPFLLTLNNVFRPTFAGRGDYAANSGNDEPSDQRAPGPKNYAEAEKWIVGPNRLTQWAATDHNGIVFQRSSVQASQVTNGLSRTYLFGEKFLESEEYKSGKSYGDDQGLCIGYDRDNARSTNLLHPPIRDANLESVWLAAGDNAQVVDWNFGSAHPNTFNMSMCDGSVDRVAYDIDMKIFSAKGSRGK